MGRRITVISLLVLILIGALILQVDTSVSKDKDGHTNTSLDNFLNLKDKYFINELDANSLTIYVEYPSFRPNSPNHEFVIPKTVRIYIRGEPGGDDVARFLSHATSKSEERCTSTICYARQVESDQVFDKYREGEISDYANRTKSARDYYTFISYDKQKILLIDSGSSSQTYLIKRNLNHFFIIEYQIPKQMIRGAIGTKEVITEFSKVDQEITEFIKQQIDFKKFNERIHNDR